jgi:hypothetical protein
MAWIRRDLTARELCACGLPEAEAVFRSRPDYGEGANWQATLPSPGRWIDVWHLRVMEALAAIPVPPPWG